MNAKKAKQLRQIAREVTPGQPAVRYKPRSHKTPSLELHPQCTRAVYKQLKRRAQGEEL